MQVLQQSCVQSQHPPRQRNQRAADEAVYKVLFKVQKSAFKNFKLPLYTLAIGSHSARYSSRATVTSLWWHSMDNEFASQDFQEIGGISGTGQLPHSGL